jgi:hypothetical protein
MQIGPADKRGKMTRDQILNGHLVEVHQSRAGYDDDRGLFLVLYAITADCIRSLCLRATRFHLRGFEYSMHKNNVSIVKDRDSMHNDQS